MLYASRICPGLVSLLKRFEVLEVVSLSTGDFKGFQSDVIVGEAGWSRSCSSCTEFIMARVVSISSETPAILSDAFFTDVIMLSKSCDACEDSTPICLIKPISRAWFTSRSLSLDLWLLKASKASAEKVSEAGIRRSISKD